MQKVNFAYVLRYIYLYVFFLSCKFWPGKIAVFEVCSKFSCELKSKEIFSVFYTAYMFFYSCEFKPGKNAVFDVFSKFSYE